MNPNLTKLASRLLRETADKFDAGTCDMTEDEAIDLCELLAHISLSAEQAKSYLNVSDSTFSNLLTQGKIPRGIHRRGFKELFYYRDWYTVLILKLKSGRKK